MRNQGKNNDQMPLLFNLQVSNVSYDYIIRVIITIFNYIFNQPASQLIYTEHDYVAGGTTLHS